MNVRRQNSTGSRYSSDPSPRKTCHKSVPTSAYFSTLRSPTKKPFFHGKSPFQVLDSGKPPSLCSNPKGEMSGNIFPESS